MNRYGRSVLLLTGLVFWVLGCTKITAPADDNAPAPPVTFTLIGGGDGEAHFRWSRNTEPDFDKYRLYRSIGTAQTFTVLAELRQTEYVDRFLDYNLTYFYYLTAVDFAGNESERSDILDVQPLNISSPTPPTNLRVSGQNNPTLSRLEMVLSWTPPNVSDVARYLVYRGATEDFVPDSTLLIGTTFTSTFFDRNVQPGLMYYYRVVAEDRGAKRSLPGPVGSDRVLPNVRLNTPANQSIFTQPRIFTWTGVENAVAYEVFVGRGPFSDVIWASGRNQSLEVLYNGPELAANRIYYWWVGAYSKTETMSQGILIAPEVNSFSEIWTFFVE